MSDARQELLDWRAADYKRVVAERSDPFPFERYETVADTIGFGCGSGKAR